MKFSKSKILVCLTAVSTFIYLLWRTFFTLPFGYGTIAILFGSILLFAEVFGMAEQIIHFKSMTVMESPKKPDVKGMEYPSVDVFIATYNEPPELLFKTVNACNNMKYPQKEKVKIYLCDDGNRKEVRQLAKKLGVNYLARACHQGAKAGNLNHALENSNGDLVVTFDADMIPMRDFLMECVPYFMPDLEHADRLEWEDGEEARKKRKGKIGFVQTPQSFYNPDLFQYNLYSEDNIPNEQDYFYKDIQLAKNRTNSVIYGGSNTIISREALEEIGGFVTNVITEDFATGMLMQSKGYQCIAIDKVHASGLSPEDVESLIKQRRRWARGCIQTGRKWNIMTRKGLSFQQKVSYLASIAYWYDSIKRLVYVLAPIMYSVFGITVFAATPMELLIFWLPMYWINRETIRWLSGNIRTLQWTNIYETIMFPLLLKDVLLEIAGLSQTKFVVTRKGKAKENLAYQLKMAIPHMVLAGLTAIGTARCIYVIFATGDVSISFLMFWLIVNMYNLLMALFFMLGRKSLRKSERFYIEADCVICTEEEMVKTKTCDISEGGFSVILDYPQYMNPEKEMEVFIEDKGYSAQVYAKIVQVMRQDTNWKYAFQIVKYEEEDYKQLLHILHDRVPPLTMQVKEHVGFYDNIRTNVLKRTVLHSHEFNRKLPRIMMEKEITDGDKEKVILQSFDYWYVSLETERSLYPKRNRTIQLGEDLELELEFEKELHYGENANHPIRQVGLYKIRNRDALLRYANLTDLLMCLDVEYRDWLKTSESEKKEVKDPEFDELALL